MAGYTLWFTGIPASGKTTIAQAVIDRLEKEGQPFAKMIDGDEIREELNWDLSSSVEDRNTNQKRIAYIAKTITQCGCIAVNASISPFKENRVYARDLISKVGPYFEIHVEVPLDVAMERDEGRGKLLYQKAREGKLADVTGYHDTDAARYDVPENPELKLDVVANSIDDSVEAVVRLIKDAGLWV